MTIDEAIKILTDLTYHGIHAKDQELEDAHKLGIEALKRISQLRLEPEDYEITQLLGETKE